MIPVVHGVVTSMRPVVGKSADRRLQNWAPPMRRQISLPIARVKQVGQS